MEEKNNIAVFIDGFNYYHAICDHMKNVAHVYNLKWLNYDKVVKDLIIKKRKYDKLAINFYTAINTHKFDNKGKPHKSIENHKIYTKALRTKGINVVEGVFKFRSEKLNCYLDCPNGCQPFFVHKFKIETNSPVKCYCGKEILLDNLYNFKKVEEKKTDVKIAVDVINAAKDGNFNRIYLFSTDSDFVPVAEYIKKSCPEVKLYIVAPNCKKIKTIEENGQIITKSEYRYGTSDFEKIGTEVIRLKLSKFRNCLFPNTLGTLKNPWSR